MSVKNNSVNQSIERAAKILELFTVENRELSLAEIARQMNIATTTALPLLNALEKSGYLERKKENKKYFLGLKFIEKSGLVLSGIDLIKIAEKACKILSQELNCAVHIGVLEGTSVVVVHRCDGRQELIDTVYPATVGKRLPVHSTAMGLVLAAYSKTELDPDFEQFTEHTVSNKTDFKRLLDKVYSEGFAIDNEMNQLGGLCVSAPIFSYNGNVVAAISVSMIKTENRLLALPNIVSKVRSAAQEISKKMGHIK